MVQCLIYSRQIGRAQETHSCLCCPVLRADPRSGLLSPFLVQLQCLTSPAPLAILVREKKNPHRHSSLQLSVGLKALLLVCVPRLCYAAVDGTCIHVSHSTGSSSRGLPAHLLEKVSQIHRSILIVSDPGWSLERRSLCPTPLSSPSAGSSIAPNKPRTYTSRRSILSCYMV